VQKRSTATTITITTTGHPLCPSARCLRDLKQSLPASKQLDSSQNKTVDVKSFQHESTVQAQAATEWKIL